MCSFVNVKQEVEAETCILPDRSHTELHMEQQSTFTEKIVKQETVTNIEGPGTFILPDTAEITDSEIKQKLHMELADGEGDNKYK